MTPKPTRAQPDEALAAAVVRLREALAIAGHIYATSPNNRRAAVIAALNAVYEFVDVGLEVVDEPELMTPLSALAAALADLERGITPPLLKPRRVHGHPRDPHGREMTKGAAAAAMSLLMDVGLGRVDAAKRVAKELQRLGVALEGDHHLLNWRTVASWRDQVRAAPARDYDFGASTTYRIVMERMTAAEGWPPSAPDQLDPQQRARFCDALLTTALPWLLSHGGS
jgi:hypothetical protein